MVTSVSRQCYHYHTQVLARLCLQDQLILIVSLVIPPYGNINNTSIQQVWMTLSKFNATHRFVGIQLWHHMWTLWNMSWQQLTINRHLKVAWLAISGTDVLTSYGWMNHHWTAGCTVGDLVWSALVSECEVSSHNACDNGVQTFALQPVTHVFTTRRSSSHYSQIRTFVDINTLNTVVASNDHPIYEVTCECWIPASALNSSHKLLSAVNTIVHVLDVHTLSNDPDDLVTCYNIEVAQNHNYLISTSQTHESSILVHNPPREPRVPNARPTYLAIGGHPDNGQVGDYGSLTVRSRRGRSVTRGHFVPKSKFWLEAWKYSETGLTLHVHHHVLYSRFSLLCFFQVPIPPGNANMVAIVHDSDVEHQLTSTSSRAGSEPAAGNYQKKLKRILTKSMKYNNGKTRSSDWCTVLRLEIDDWKQGLSTARQGAPSPMEQAAYKVYMTKAIQAHRTYRINIIMFCYAL